MSFEPVDHRPHGVKGHALDGGERHQEFPSKKGCLPLLGFVELPAVIFSKQYPVVT